MSGAQGSGSTGGQGYTLSKTVRLRKGQVLKWSIGQQGAFNGGGGMSQLLVDDTLVLVSGGGTAPVPAPTGLPSYVYSGGQGMPNGASGVVYYHVHDSHDCYGYREHTHTSSCPKSRGKHSYDCGVHCYHKDEKHQACEGFDIYDCGDSPKNTDYGLTCTKSITTLERIEPAQPGGCYAASGWSADAQALNRSGNGAFSIKLADHNLLWYKNVNVQSGAYKNNRFNLVILDDTVVFYKRQ